MTPPMNRFTLDRVEQTLLALFFLVLPGYEAPKNIALWGFLIYWTARRLRHRPVVSVFGPANWYFDGPLLGIVVLGGISSFGAMNPGQSFLDGLDFMAIALLAIVLRRSAVSRDQYLGALVLIALGIALALADGYFRRGIGFPVLHSVGHINHVAIYLATAAAAALAFAWRTTGARRFLGLIAFCLIAWVCLQTNSRNTAFGLGLVLFLVLWAALYFDKHKRFSALLLGMLIAVTGAAMVLQLPAYQKQIDHLKSGSVDKVRSKILYTAWVVGAERPVLGHGVGQWQTVTKPDNVNRIVTKNGGLYNSHQFFFTTHGHNLAATWYAERGLGAIGLLGFFFLYCSFRLWRAVKSEPCSVEPAVGFVVLWATIFYGLGNTSLHHEHGLLALSFIGVAMQQSESDDAIPV